MKTCTKCKIEKPFEAFSKNKVSKDGYNFQCKECRKSRDIELKKSPLMQLEKQIRSSIILENKLLAREGKRLCGKCKDIFLIDDLNTQGFCENCEIVHNREHYEKNKDKRNEYQREWQLKNKDKRNEYRSEYRLKNKDKLNEYHRKYLREYRLKKKLERLQNESMQ